MIALLVMGLVAGVLEGIGVSLLIPLFSFFLGSDATAGNYAVPIGFINSALNFLGIEKNFQSLLIIVLVLFAIKTALVIYFGVVKAHITAQYKNWLRSDIYRKLLNSNFSFLRKQKMGHLDNVLIQSVKISARLLEHFMSLLVECASFFAYLFVAFAISPSITLVAFLFGIILTLGMRPLIRSIGKYSSALVYSVKRVSHALNESIIGIKAIRTTGVEKEVLSVIGKLFNDIESAELKKQLVKHYAKVVIEPASILLILGAFYVSYKSLSFNIVSFAAIMYLISRMFGQVSKIQSGMHILKESLPSAYDVTKLMKEIGQNQLEFTGSGDFSFKKIVEFKDVSYAYDKTRDVLSKLSFSVPKGTIVGVVGPSGAGKTTIVDLLLRLLIPSAGSVLLDGVDIASIKIQDWRRYVGYVPQDVFIKNDTIAENISFYDTNIDEKRIDEAAQMADVYDFVQALPKKFNTVVEERGMRFSGGERQRIALARVLARRPQILILDEATSALDAETENFIKETIRDLRGKVTILIIAHKPSILDLADSIVVLEGGRVVEEGSPTRLLEDKNTYFSRMVEHHQVNTES
jgi:ATP-binding cassette subfamily C protein